MYVVTLLDGTKSAKSWEYRTQRGAWNRVQKCKAEMAFGTFTTVRYQKYGNNGAYLAAAEYKPFSKPVIWKKDQV